MRKSKRSKKSGGSGADASAKASPSSIARAFFADRSYLQIAEWVRIGIERHVDDAGSFEGFAPLADYFNSDLTVSEGVAAIYSDIGSESRAKLRNGLALALDHIPVSAETVPVIKEILYCARRLPAPEIFSFLPKKMKGMRDSEGPFFDASSKDVDGRTLFDVAFQVTVDMPVAASLWVLKELVASTHFHVSQSGLALDALCRVDPQNFPEYFDQLRDRLDAMFSTYRTPPGIKQLLAKRLITSIGLEFFRRKSHELRFEASSARPNDNWFFDSLFGPGALLIIAPGEKIAWSGRKPVTWYTLMVPEPPAGRPSASVQDGLEPRHEDVDPAVIMSACYARLGTAHVHAGR